MSTANFKLDFSDVKDNGGSKFYCVPGKYLAKVTKCERDNTKTTGEPCLKWELEVTTPSQKGKVLNMMTVLTAPALWKLKQVLEAMGYVVPKSAFTITPAAYVGKVVGVEVKDREYNGKTYSDVKNVFKMSELVNDGDELEDAAPTSDDDDPFEN